MAYELEQTSVYPGGMVDSEFREIRSARNADANDILFGRVVSMNTDLTCKLYAAGEVVFGISAFEQKVGDTYAIGEIVNVCRKGTIYTMVGGAAAVEAGDKAYALDLGLVTNDDGGGANAEIGVFMGAGQPDEYVAVQINLP